MDPKKVVLGGLCGLASAVLVDLRAWNAEGGAPWSWSVATKHWAIGFLTGVLTGAGVSLV